MPAGFLLALAADLTGAGLAEGVLVSAVFMGRLDGFSGTGCGGATGAGFRATGLALALVGVAALGLTGIVAAFATTDFAFVLTGTGVAFATFTATAFFGTAFADAIGAFALLAVALAVTLAAVTGFAGAAGLAMVFLALLDTGLLTGFLVAFATIDSSVGDTAL